MKKIIFFSFIMLVLILNIVKIDTFVFADDPKTHCENGDAFWEKRNLDYKKVTYIKSYAYKSLLEYKQAMFIAKDNQEYIHKFMRSVFYIAHFLIDNQEETRLTYALAGSIIKWLDKKDKYNEEWVFKDIKDKDFINKVKTLKVIPDGKIYCMGSACYGEWAKHLGLFQQANDVKLKETIMPWAEKAIKLTPNFQEAMPFLVMGKIYRESPGKPFSVGDIDKAIKCFEETVKRFRSPLNLYYLAEALANKDKRKYRGRIIELLEESIDKFNEILPTERAYEIYLKKAENLYDSI